MVRYSVNHETSFSNLLCCQAVTKCLEPRLESRPERYEQNEHSCRDEQNIEIPFADGPRNRLGDGDQASAEEHQ